MPAGFQAFNTAGTVQVDENYFNLLLLSAGQAPRSTFSPRPGTSEFVYQVVTPVSSIVAVRPPVNTNYAARLVGIWDSGGLRRWIFQCDVLVDGAQGWTDGPPTLQYYVFGKAGPPAAHGAGLEVFNAAGERVYYSGDYPLRPVYFEPLDDSLFYQGPIKSTYTTLGSGTYAIVIADIGLEEYAEPDGPQTYYNTQIIFYGTTGTGYRHVTYYFEGYGSGGDLASSYDTLRGCSGALIVNVANFPTNL